MPRQRIHSGRGRGGLGRSNEVIEPDRFHEGTARLTLKARLREDESEAPIAEGNVDVELVPAAVVPPTIQGTITDSSTGNAISGANIEIELPQGYSTQSDTNGRYTIDIPAGTYTVTATANGYETQTRADIVVNSGETVIVDFALNPIIPEPSLTTPMPTAPVTTELEFQFGVREGNGSVALSYIKNNVKQRTWTTSSSTVNVDRDSEFTLTANPDNGYVFDSWYGELTHSDGKYSVLELNKNSSISHLVPSDAEIVKMDIGVIFNPVLKLEISNRGTPENPIALIIGQKIGIKGLNADYTGEDTEDINFVWELEQEEIKGAEGIREAQQTGVRRVLDLDKINNIITKTIKGGRLGKDVILTDEDNKQIEIANSIAIELLIKLTQKNQLLDDLTRIISDEAANKRFMPAMSSPKQWLRDAGQTSEINIVRGNAGIVLHIEVPTSVYEAYLFRNYIGLIIRYLDKVKNKTVGSISAYTWVGEPLEYIMRVLNKYNIIEMKPVTPTDSESKSPEKDSDEEKIRALGKVADSIKELSEDLKNLDEGLNK